ncbi:MAG TPA: zf-HC2 domain-containing protein [bacterium]|nr:zf-HC2 domain-containing protein [bacterium]HPN43311.1 zf-HC2 domain-containing protein [bacterium]
MDCEDFINRLCDDLAEDINSEVCEQIKRHLETCSDCRTQLAAMKNTVNLFKCMGEIQVPIAVHERLITMLNVKNAAK